MHVYLILVLCVHDSLKVEGCLADNILVEKRTWLVLPVTDAEIHSGLCSEL